MTVAKQRGQAGARAPGRRPWGRINTLFQPFKNAFLSTNFDQNISKNANFLEKNCKSPQRRGTAPALLLASGG